MAVRAIDPFGLGFQAVEGCWCAVGGGSAGGTSRGILEIGCEVY